MSTRDESIYLVADVCYAVLGNDEMQEVTEALKIVSVILAEEPDMWTFAETISQHIGLTDNKPLRDVLVKLHTRFEQYIHQRELVRLRGALEKDTETGWAEWLRTYTDALNAWRLLLCQALAEADLPVPEHVVADIPQIRQYTRYLLHSRFVEGSELFNYLLRQEGLSNIQRAKLYVNAATIQLYYISKQKEAKKLIECADELAPQEGMVQMGWGAYWLQKDDFAKAQEYLQEAIRREPHDASSYLLMGDCHKEQYNFDAAEEWYIESTKMRSLGSDVSGYIRLLNLYGSTEERLKKYESQFPLLIERAIAVDPTATYSLYVEVGAIYQQLQNYERAYHWYNQAIAFDETQVDAYISKGFAALEEEDSARAEVAFQKVIALAPESFDGYWGMGWTCERQELWQKALDYYEHSLLVRPEWEGTIRNRMGEMKWKLQRYQEAEEELNKAMQCEPEEESFLDTLETWAEDYYKQHNNPDAALRIYETIRSNKGSSYDASYHNRLGNMKYYAEQYKDAAEDYKRAIAADPTDPVYHSNLAYAWENMKTPGQRCIELEHAISALNEALKLAPQDNDYAKRLEVLELQKRVAEKSGEFVLGLSPVLTIIRGELGSVLARPFYRAGSKVPGEVQELIDALRQRIRQKYGVTIPGIRFRENQSIESGGYIFTLSGTRLVRGEVPVEKRFFPGTSEELSVIQNPFHVQTEGVNPYTDKKGYWLTRSAWLEAQEHELHIWQEMEYPLRHLERVLQKNLAEFLDHQEVERLLTGTKVEEDVHITSSSEKYSALIQVLKALVAEEVPITTLDQICSAFVELVETEMYLITVIEKLRSLPILQPTLPGNNAEYTFYRLEQHFEEELEQCITRTTYSPVFTIRSRQYRDILDAVSTRLKAQQQVALLVSNSLLRPFIRILIERDFPEVPVLTSQELSSELSGNIVGEIKRVEIDEFDERDAFWGWKRTWQDWIDGAWQDRVARMEPASYEKEYGERYPERKFGDAIAIQDIVTVKVFLGRNGYDISFDEALAEMQKDLFEERGILIPTASVAVEESLDASEFRLQFNDLQLPPMFAGGSSEEFLENTISSVSDEIKKYSSAFLTTDDIAFLLHMLRQTFPTLAENVLKRFDLVRLPPILKGVLDKGLSIRDLRTILETLVALNGTIDTDQSEGVPFFPGITRLGFLGEEQKLIFFPHTAKLCPTSEGKKLENLDTMDYVNYLRLVLKH